MPLTSPQHTLLQKVRRAVAAGRPLGDGSIAAEGPHLLAEALKSPWSVTHILCSSECIPRHNILLAEASRHRIEVTEVASRAFKAVSDTEQSQGVLCLLRPRPFLWPDLLKSSGPLVILDGIQDPGNAGTIVRSTEAFGGAGVALTEGCVRISNGKFLRAAAGSLFRLPLIENVPRIEIITQIVSTERSFFSLTANGRISLASMSLSAPFALVVGSEGHGVSPALLAASQTISIPTSQVESLNAAIACSITLYEATRQRAAHSV